MYKRLIEGKKAVFFDMDGTIVDTEPLMRQAFDRILSPIHMDWFDQDELPEGISLSAKWEYIFTKYKEYAPQNYSIKDYVDRTFNEFLNILTGVDLEAKNGFWDLAYELKTNKGVKLVLVSNSPRRVVDAVLNKINIKATFDFIIAGDEVKKAKPDPEIYQKAIKELKVKPNEVLVFEDSLIGAAAAYGADLSMVIIWNSKAPKFDYPPKVLLFTSDFENLDRMLDTNLDEEIQRAAQNTPTDVA